MEIGKETIGSYFQKNQYSLYWVGFILLFFGFIYDWERFLAFYDLDYNLRKLAGLHMKGTQAMQEHFSISGNFEKWLFSYWIKQILYSVFIYLAPMIWIFLKIRKNYIKCRKEYLFKSVL